MKGAGFAALTLLVLATGLAPPLSAHPAPFSYVDVRLEAGALDLTVIAHVFDLAHDLGVGKPETLLDPVVLSDRAAQLQELVDRRLTLTSEGSRLSPGTWDAPIAFPDRQSIMFHRRLAMSGRPGSIVVDAHLFPYDSQHQTFVNFYQQDAIRSQVMMDHGRTRFEYIARGAEGVLVTAQQFVVAGVRHIVMGPDHLIFLLGLLLLGGKTLQLVRLAGAFTIAQAATLILAGFGFASPRQNLIEPAIALSIVYVGVDNLLVRDGRDMRVWIALVFGLIHGFAYAGTLQGRSLQTQALGWAIVFFSLGAVVGQVIVVVAIASFLSALKSRSEWASRQLAFAGSVVVMAAGTFWFIQRVFFSGGIS